MHYQIWIGTGEDDRRLPTQSPRLLERVGLADLAHNFDALDCPGPDGRAGRMYGWLSPPQPRIVADWSELQADPAKRWQGLEAGRYLLAWWPAAPPTAEELRRPHTWPGDFVELGGQQWLIATPERLPVALVLADDGQLAHEPIRRMSRYVFSAEYEAACRAWQETLAGGASEAEFDPLWRFAVEALRQNYRITPEVVSLLRLLTDENVHRPMLAATGAIAAAHARRAGA